MITFQKLLHEVNAAKESTPISDSSSILNNGSYRLTLNGRPTAIFGLRAPVNLVTRI